MPDTMKAVALDYINRHLVKDLKSLDNALNRMNNDTEISNLWRNVSVLNYLYDLVEKDDEDA